MICFVRSLGFRSALVLSLVLASFSSLAAQNSRAKKGAQKDEAAIRHYKSRNFVVHTDLSKEEGKKLLERLETMLALVSKYFGRPNRKPIECYVVKDADKWPAGTIDPEGLASILSGGGVTKSQGFTLGARANVKAIVYAGADRGTPQHEAVHAYCAQTFGRTGPTWYSEGMAEVGKYFREEDKSVEIHPGVLRYLQTSEPKTLDEIVNSNEVTGDSWQNYAWRWALCHMLGNNPNYAKRFRPLGLSLLTDRKRLTFNNTYGPMAKEITFEYEFFLDHIEQGFRVDLCAWDWKTRFRKPRRSRSRRAKIDAGKGWQASGVLVEKDAEYEVEADGTWELAKALPEDEENEADAGEDEERTRTRRRSSRRGSSREPERETEAVDADGKPDGRGRLMGVIFSDYELSEPFELGAECTFKAPQDGQLFLRCREKWGQIAHNEGTITVRISRP